MGWIDDYDEPTLRSPEYSDSGDELRATPEKTWARSAAETAGFPKTAAWMAGEYAGRPESAPGALYDILPEVGNWAEPLAGAAKGAINMGTQAVRRAAMSKAMPGMGEIISQTNPINRAIQTLKGYIPNVSDIGEAAPVMARDWLREDPDAAPIKSVVQQLRQGIGDAFYSDVHIPYNPTGTKYPWAIITKDPDNQILPSIATRMSQNRTQYDSGLSGVYSPRAEPGTRNFIGDVIGAWSGGEKSLGDIVGHETSHVATNRGRGYPTLNNAPEDLVYGVQARLNPEAPSEAGDKLLRHLVTVARDNPGETALIQNSKAYRNMGLHDVGDELLARFRGGDEPWITDYGFMTMKKQPVINDPTFDRRLSETTQDLIHPYFTEPNLSARFVNAPIGGVGNLLGRLDYGDY